MKTVAPFLAPSAALLWVLTCLRWFDAGRPYRPAWLDHLPLLALVLPLLAAFVLWLRTRWADLRGEVPSSGRGGLLLVVGLSLLVGTPLAVRGAAGYTTSDGALSGIVALHVRDGVDHLAFVPQVPYSGSLKSHLTAPLAAWIDPARAFALWSTIFYALFVASVHRLALLAAAASDSSPGSAGRVALAAGLYVALPPVFVHHYSLSNDGNYVEVLAFGTWALVLAAEWVAQPSRRQGVAVVLGLLLGLGFWCHILAVIHLAATGLALLVSSPRDTVRTAPRVGAGFLLGYMPGLLWNAGNGWASFAYLLPGGPRVGSLEAGPGLFGRLGPTLTDLAPVLLGYEPGYGPALDATLRALAWLGVVASVVAAVRAVGLVAQTSNPPDARTRSAHGTLLVLLLFGAVNLMVTLAALPYLPGNPRYLLFLMAPIPVFLALTFAQGRARALLVALVTFGALSSLAHARGPLRADREWRAFVSDLEGQGVRWCMTDFYLATKINFLSGERVVCSAKLGPTTTEYFFEYRRQVDAAPEAALVAVNLTAAEKLERRLERLGVTYERIDLMKPVLLRLSRKVDPGELFPGREFPLR